MRLLLSEEQIAHRVDALAQEIAGRGAEIHLVCVLKGAFVFCSDLARALSRNGADVRIDFLTARSYEGKETTGRVQLSHNFQPRGTNLLLVEDIVDTGLAIKAIVRHLESRGAASVRICSLLSKPSRRKAEVKIDYLGFEIPDVFAVGYGLDCDEEHRGLPHISALD